MSWTAGPAGTSSAAGAATKPESGGTATTTGTASMEVVQQPTSCGHDAVGDFTVGVEHLQFSGLQSLWDLNVAQVGADTVITYGVDNSITLAGVDANALLQHHLTDLLI